MQLPLRTPRLSTHLYGALILNLRYSIPLGLLEQDINGVYTIIRMQETFNICLGHDRECTGDSFLAKLSNLHKLSLNKLLLLSKNFTPLT